MQKIITVHDMFEIPNRGLVLGGVNPDLDTMDDKQIKELIGAFIEIRKLDGSKIKTRVIDVDISTSLSNKKNIFILLSTEIQKKDLTLESVVYRDG
jgi:hypothetical protein